MSNTNTFKGSSKTTYQLVYKPNGTRYAPTVVSSAYGPYDGTFFKTSVNTGKFIPGVYRVNPYGIGSQHFVSEDFVTLGAEWEDTYYRYTISTIGQLLTQFIRSGSGIPDLVPSEKLRAIVVTRAWSKLGRSQLSLGTELGEFKETASMLMDPFSALKRYLYSGPKRLSKAGENLRSILNFRRSGRFKNEVKGAAKAAAETWMELRYGMLPAISSMAAILDYLDQAGDGTASKAIRSVRSRLTGIPVGTTKSYTIQADASQYWRIPIIVEVSDFVDALGVVHYRQDSVASRLTELGLDLRYLPETAWELTSRSFVWDWFIGIGAWIAAHRVTPEQSILGSTGSLKIMRHVVAKASGPAYINSAPHVKKPFPWQAAAIYTRFDRAINQKPSFLPLFHEKPRLDLLKIIDGLIMAHQGITKGLR